MLPLYFNEVYWLYLATEGRKDLIINTKSMLSAPTLRPNKSHGKEILEIVCVCVYICILNFLIKLNVRGYLVYDEQLLSKN